MATLNYPWAVVVTNTLDDEIEITVHKTQNLAKKALVDDLLDEARVQEENGAKHRVDATTLNEQDCAKLYVMSPSGLDRYHYMWQLIHIPEPKAR